MTYAYDFSIVPGPAPATMKANDGDGVLTYGTGSRQTPEYLTACDAAGLKIALVWEHNTDSILGGYDYGVAEARAWNASNPEGYVVYLAADMNDGALAGRDIKPFVLGFASAMRAGDDLGVYGSDDAIAQAKSLPVVHHLWGVVNWLHNGGPDNDPANIQRWRDLGVDLIQLIGSPVAGTDQNLVVRSTWATPHPAAGPSSHREVNMVIYHNKEVHDADPLKGTGEWVAMFGSDGPTHLSAAEVAAHVGAGVPWIDNYTTLQIIALGMTGAQARKDARFWDSKVPA